MAIKYFCDLCAAETTVEARYKVVIEPEDESPHTSRQLPRQAPNFKPLSICHDCAVHALTPPPRSAR